LRGPFVGPHKQPGEDRSPTVAALW